MQTVWVTRKLDDSDQIYDVFLLLRETIVTAYGMRTHMNTHGILIQLVKTVSDQIRFTEILTTIQNGLFNKLNILLALPCPIYGTVPQADGNI